MNKKNLPKYFKIFSLLISSCFLVWVGFASKIFFTPSHSTWLMYCQQSIEVMVENSDYEIQAIDMVLTYTGDEIEWAEFIITDPVNYYDGSYNQYNNSLWFDTWKFGGARSIPWMQNSTQKSVWILSFQNKTGVIQTLLWFYALNPDGAGDTNLANAGIDRLDVPWWVWSARFDFVVGPCSMDNEVPEIPSGYRSIANGANRVNSGQNITARFIDQSIIHADFWYPSDDFSLSNYVTAPSRVDNQYGVHSGTIKITIAGDGYNDEYELWGINGFDTITATGLTRHRRDKWYDIVVDPIRNFGIEETITVTMEAYDNIFWLKTTSYHQSTNLIFNQSQAPYVVRNTTIQWRAIPDQSPTKTSVVDPDIQTIKFAVVDEWAGVDSGSLTVTIRTGTASSPDGGIVKNYANNEFELSGFVITYPSNGVLGSNQITHTQNYDITLTWFGALPENSYIWIVIEGDDLVNNTFQAPSNRFVFETRQSCETLQCTNGVKIYTWGILSDWFVMYTQSWLWVTGGNQPVLSGNNLFCSDVTYGPLDVLKDGTEISYGNSTWGMVILNDFTWQILTINAIDGTIQLVGNTLYFLPSPPFCGNSIIDPGETCDDGNRINGDGCNAQCHHEVCWDNICQTWENCDNCSNDCGSCGWWGWGGGWPIIYKDDCLLPNSTLPGANRDGIDYSPSYYDRDCGEGPSPEEEIREIAPMCEIWDQYTANLEAAYIYACKLGITSMDNINDANLQWVVIRKELAKMIVEYATSIFFMQPDQSRVCEFQDIGNESLEMQSYIKAACQLGLMWLQSNGEPDIIFNPNNIVSKAEFATAFSRLLYGNKYNTNDENNRYQQHMQALKDDYILDDINNPFAPELRGLVMDMMRRTDKSNFVSVIEADIASDKETICSVSPYGEELENAYLYACHRRITTMPDIQEANMYGWLIRSHLAKMVGTYAIQVLGMEPNEDKACYYRDTQNETLELKYRIQKVCQLDLMGVEYDGVTPMEKFMPYEYVTRAQWATIFSRLLFGKKYDGNVDCWYCSHIQWLFDFGIMKDVWNPDERIELRWRVMLMMQRSEKILDGIVEKE